MIWTHAGFFVGHWELALAATAAGFVLALAYLLCDYLFVPAWRFRIARRRGPEAVRAFIRREALRLDRLENAAAVCEEHAHPDAAAVRDEIELRALVLRFFDPTRRR